MAQTKKTLEGRRVKLMKDIALTDKMLKQTAQTRTTTYDRFVALQGKIERRERLIGSLGREIYVTEDSILKVEQNIEGLTRNISVLRVEYAEMVRGAFRRRAITNPLLFILSAESLNQAFRRWLLLLKYDRYRRGQEESILFNQTKLTEKRANLANTRAEKEKLRDNLNGQQATLELELVEKDNLVQTLARDEVRLKADLQKKQADYEALNAAIERVIQEEVRKKTLEARSKPKTAPPVTPVPVNPAPAPPGKTNVAPPIAAAPPKTAPVRPAAPLATAREQAEDEEALSVGFRRQQGNLPWPVENGFISRFFGRQKHPTIRNIEITNNGIDIRTEEGESVRVVYDGVVAGVQFIPGHNYTVIIQHGNYYTVYANLDATDLTEGISVSARQTIGEVSTNPITGAADLHFEVWYQKERMNPTGWIEE